MKSRELKNVEWGIIVVAIILSIIGIVALFSATKSTNHQEFTKQIGFLVVSLIAMVITMLIDYNSFVKISSIGYGAVIVLLIGVLFTTPVNGATSWFDLGFFSFQPSEFAKLVIILFITYIINRIQKRGFSNINKVKNLALIFVCMIVPILLIINQPDYGTAMAIIFGVGFMLIAARLDKKYIIYAIVLIIIGVPLLYMYILPEHATKRIDVFLNPESDPRGDGYNIIQSKIAIGSGRITGMGYLQGNQTQLGYLHPKTTDFIFAVISEELGFIVAAPMIIMYVYLITKAIYIAKTAKDLTGTLIASGITGIFIFHTVENIGMVMGLLPITGVPLLFVSYGGSSLLISYISLGLLLNISSKRQKTIFVK